MASQERFLHDVRDHKLVIQRANGCDRFLKFRTPGTSTYWFELVTWPGALCIRGDCGTYVFSRIEDMFDFFRSPSGQINPGYWEEKCVSRGRHEGVQQWSPARFRGAVVRDFRNYWRDEDRSLRRECFRQLRSDVLSAEGEFEAMNAVSSFEWDGFRFDAFWEHHLTDYTFHFLWCLRAIVWGIQQFDAAQQPVPAVEAARG